VIHLLFIIYLASSLVVLGEMAKANSLKRTVHGLVVLCMMAAIFLLVLSANTPIR